MTGIHKDAEIKEILNPEVLGNFLKQSRWIIWGTVLMVSLIFTVRASAQNPSLRHTNEENAEPYDPAAEEKAYKADSKMYTYKDMLRRPDIEGEKVQIKGRVSQVQQEGDVVFLNIITKEKDSLVENVFVYYKRKDEKEIRFLEEDIVTLWGEFIGLETYTNKANNERTVPAIIMAYYKIAE